MTAAQVILLIGMLGFALYVTRLRSTLSDRLIYLVILVTGIPLVLHPSWSTDLARALGIGRGADLIFYLFILLNLFYYATSASRTRRQEQDFVKLVRAYALHHPFLPDSANTADDRSSPVGHRAPSATE